MTTNVRQEMLEAEDALQAVDDLQLQKTLWRRESVAEERRVERDKEHVRETAREDDLREQAFIASGPKGPSGINNYDWDGNLI